MIGIWIPLQQLDDVGLGFHAARVELQRDQMGQRNDSQARSGSHAERRLGMAAVDDSRKPLTEVDDLHQPGRADHVEHPAQWILPVRLPYLDRVAGFAKPVRHRLEVAYCDAHAKVDVFGVANVAMRGEGRGTDQHRIDAAIGEEGGDTFSGCEQTGVIRHRRDSLRNWARARPIAPAG